MELCVYYCSTGVDLFYYYCSTDPSSPNKDECCGWGWLPRIREGSGGGQASLTVWRPDLEARLCGRGAFEGFPRVNPVLWVGRRGRVQSPSDF